VITALLKVNKMDSTNAPICPQFDGQIVKFKSPHAAVMLYDQARRNPKYGHLEWCALNEPTTQQLTAAQEVTA
jgi:hypothetical protein